MRKSIIPLLAVTALFIIMQKSDAEINMSITDSLETSNETSIESSVETSIETSLDSFDIPPFIGEKFIRYMEKPDKRPRGDKPPEKRFYVLEVSTDVMEGGIRRAMPFTTIVRNGKEYFVAFEVVTSFDSKEEVLKYAEENGVTDIDLSNYEDMSPETDDSD